MKLGISTWSLLRSDLYSAISAIGDAGFDYIELWGEVPHAYHDWVDKRRLRDALSTYSFTVTMHAPFTSLNPAVHFEPVRGAVARTLKDFVRFAGNLGAERVTFHPGSVHSSVLLSQSTGDAVSLLRDLVKESSGALVINIENQVRKCSQYNFPLCGDAEAMASLLASVEGASQTLDTGHAHINGDQPLGWFERFRDSVSEIHLCDNDGTNDEHLIPGQGTADLRGLLDRVAGTDVLVCLESDPFRYSSDEVLRTAQSLRRGGFPSPSPRPRK